MTEHNQRSTSEPAPVEADESAWVSRLPHVVWTGVSIVFLVYIAFGSIEARIWVSGRLTFKERSIAHVWRYFGDRLPDMPGGAIFPILYYFSLTVLILGTIYGIGLFLFSGRDAIASSPPDHSPATPLND